MKDSICRSTNKNEQSSTNLLRQYLHHCQSCPAHNDRATQFLVPAAQYRRPAAKKPQNSYFATRLAQQGVAVWFDTNHNLDTIHWRVKRYLMGKQKHLLMKNKKYICLCWMKKMFKCRRQTSSSFASDQSWDDFIPSFYQILIQSHPPRNIFTSWNILFVLQNINVWLKIYFYQISPLLMQQCVAATLWHTALCAECDANLIRNSEEICFQRHFYSARAWESSASSAQAVTTLSKQFSLNLLESKDF